jgi:hypothetical protein
MRTCVAFFLFLTIIQFESRAQWQDSISLQGQVSAWGGFNGSLDLPVWLGARYIPQVNFLTRSGDNRMFDFEVSANLNGSLYTQPFSEFSDTVVLKPYRAWARYSGRQFEVRLGLQKINFGTAALLRPLMWFDQIDPRDPLQLTDGVWGLLGRWYFLNNANVWLWGLFGNKGPKTWEQGETRKWTPELGGRVQMPIFKGEAALSYHFREARYTIDHVNGSVQGSEPEHRLGLDGKWDIGPGVWFEATWLHKTIGNGSFNDTEFLCNGTDYTFAVGNGLNAILEHLFFSGDESPFALEYISSMSALSLSYPINLNNRVNIIFFRDWKNRNHYNFVNWQHQFNNISFYLMGFINPKNYYLPQQGNAGRLFAGNGFQVMFVYNY